MRVVNLYCLTWKRRVDGEDEEKGHACTCACVCIDAHRVPAWWFDGLHSQQHNFYNRWQIHPSLVIKAKARMNPTMRKKHLELQSGWTTRRLPAMRQNSIQVKFPFKWGRQQHHLGLLAAVGNLWWWRDSPSCFYGRAERRHNTHSWTLTWS